MPQPWRLVDSGMVPPPDSAALDEAILEAHIEGLAPSTLHFYRRSIPTVSVGYFQKVSESVDLAECERRGLAIIRRKSGGSSIYTDQGQLIYGLIVHESDMPAERADSFRLTCSAIASAIRSLGVDSVYRPMNDVEVGGRKISGNAQLRRKGSVLQHGTIVVDTNVSEMDAVLRVSSSRAASVTLPSERIITLRSLLGFTPNMDAVKRALAYAFEEAFEARFTPSALSDVEKTLVRKLVDERYSRREWNFKR